MSLRPTSACCATRSWQNPDFDVILSETRNLPGRAASAIYSALNSSDYFVDPDIQSARTLPARAFSDPAFLQHELETIFSRCWLPVPQRTAEELSVDSRSLTELVSLRGSHLPFNVLDRPLFLQRDWEGRLRCFPNVCTHAWFPLIHGPGRERTIVCGQHGRRFDCAGRFLSQPGFDGSQEESDNLRALNLSEWHELLFVVLSEPVLPLDELFSEIRASTSCLPLSDFRRAQQPAEVRELDGNWKQHSWNYMDVFHLSYIHRAPGGLADTIDLDSYRTELYRYSALQWAYATNPDHGFDPQLLPARFAQPGKRVFALWWLVFPNLTLNFYPWGLSINVYMPVPDRPDRTLFLWYHYVFDEQRYGDRDEIWLNRQVDAEDVDAMRQVRRGVRSGLAPRGRFAPQQEAGPHWFHRLVYETMFP
jgi:phenylpropionate dioxygenase-like ring-hydroxylating dioxygenase large terminal subunit